MAAEDAGGAVAGHTSYSIDLDDEREKRFIFDRFT
jgi:hypothetical protein